VFRAELDPILAAQAFYGLIEQVLTSWIFGGEVVPEAELERAKEAIVAIICGGLDV